MPLNVNHINQPFALFENQIDKNIDFPYELFFDPIQEIKTYEPANVSSCLKKIEELSNKNLFLVGYLSYEALSTFTENFLAKDPLVHFYAFAKKQSLSSVDFEKSVFKPPVVYDFQLNETFESYEKKISKIKEYQRQGDTYQVNFTMKNRFQWQGSSFELFLELKKYQQVSMAAFLHFDKDICSYSPELFIKKTSHLITSKPMKGTAPRGKDSVEDERIIKQLSKDPKTLSENLMIVDLIRNDLGKIALPGTVKVPKLFEVESYSTLHQMTSTVEASIDPSISFEKIIQALFPCGSITGAPKKSTMKIIHELEVEPRHLYTGALGYILPSKDFVFNVAIRTLILSKESYGEMGIGSGIVYESDTRKEWEECLLKAKFIKMINSQIQLIETFRYDSKSKQFLRLQMHLQRLTSSAQTLGFSCHLDKIKTELEDLQLSLSNEQPSTSLAIFDKKIRLLLFQNGDFQLSHSSLEPSKTFYKVICFKKSIEKNYILQKHKTTFRKFYDDFYKKALTKGYDEVLFFNENSNCVEASRNNLILKKNEQFFTPPVTDGALPGVFRQSLFLDSAFTLKEKSLNWNDLMTADEIYLCNSVRGLVRAEISKEFLEEVLND
jgi:para-aminobenzoate synthetase/4-amino-4-deoxychorismate lyase